MPSQLLLHVRTSINRALPETRAFTKSPTWQCRSLSSDEMSCVPFSPLGPRATTTIASGFRPEGLLPSIWTTRAITTPLFRWVVQPLSATRLRKIRWPRTDIDGFFAPTRLCRQPGGAFSTNFNFSKPELAGLGSNPDASRESVLGGKLAAARDRRRTMNAQSRSGSFHVR